jgi:hypothetical protein
LAFDKKQETLAYQVRAILQKRCQSCHSGNNAKGDLKILDYETLLKKKLISNNSKFSELVQRVHEGSMPPGNMEKLGTTEREILKNWHDNGAPYFPADFGDDIVSTAILNDLRGLNGDLKAKARYVSLNHLIADPDPADSLQFYRDALQRALKSLPARKGSGAVLTPVDSAETVFRISLTDLGWDQLVYDTQIHKDKLQLNVMDIILLSYPYGRADTFASQDKAKQLEDDFLTPIKQIRPIAYVRGDWLVGAMLQRPSVKETDPTILPGYPTADIRAVAEKYSGPVGLAQVLAELGSSVTAEILQKNIETTDARDFLSPVLTEGKSIKRLDWEKRFQEVVAACGGRPIWNFDALPRADVRAAEVDKLVDFYTYDEKDGKKTDTFIFKPDEERPWTIRVRNKWSEKKKLYFEIVYQTLDRDSFLFPVEPKAYGDAQKQAEIAWDSEFVSKKGTVDKRKGKDFITILVSDQPFVVGFKEMTGEDTILNRVVHELRGKQPTFLFQKTIIMETK